MCVVCVGNGYRHAALAWRPKTNAVDDGLFFFFYTIKRRRIVF